MNRVDKMMADGEIKFKATSKSPTKLHQLKTGVIIKDVAEGVGNVDELKLQSAFVTTTRDKEVHRRQPDNGPSPSPAKFTPNYRLVHGSVTNAFQTSQTRFPNDIDYNF